MEQGFVTWDAFLGYAFFLSMVFMIVEFTKDLYWVRTLKTKHYSAIVAFLVLVVVNLHGGTFELWDLFIYACSAIVISLSANGLSDYNNKVDKRSRDIKNIKLPKAKADKSTHTE